MATLTRSYNGRTESFQLNATAVALGRGAECHIVLQDPQAQRLHCQLVRKAEGYHLLDLSGPAGTYVNGVRVKDHALKPGDIIQVGSEKLVFMDARSSPTARVQTGAPTTPVKSPTAQVATVPRPGTQAVALPQRSPTASVPVMPKPPTSAVARPATAAIPVPPRSATSTVPTMQKSPTAAVPVAPKPPTARVAPGTSAVPVAAKPATARVATRPATQARPATRSVPVRPTTQRKNQTTKGRMLNPKPGRVTSVRVHRERSLFSMPSTAKGKMIAVGGVLFLAAAGGIAYWAYTISDKPEEIKAEIKERLKKVSLMPPDKVIEADAILDEMLANKKYEKYGGADHLAITQLKKEVHPRAERQKDADRKAPEFIKKYNAVRGDENQLRGQVNQLRDEGQELLDQYRMTTHAPKLEEVVKKLEEVIRGIGVEGNWYPVAVEANQRGLKVAKESGDFTQWVSGLDEVGKKYRENEKQDLHKFLDAARSTARHEAERFVTRKITDAEQLKTDGKLDDAKKLLNDCKPGLRGFTGALTILQKGLEKIQQKDKSK